METDGNRSSLWSTESTPHSLGKPIEWKRDLIVSAKSYMKLTPHSLGKPIEWKPIYGAIDKNEGYTPHSLGKPIEWKRHDRFRLLSV